MIHLPQKTSQILKYSYKRQLTSIPLITKDKRYFNNFTCSIDLRALSYIIGKSPVYTLQLSQKSDFQLLTTKSKNIGHPTIKTGQI